MDQKINSKILLETTEKEEVTEAKTIAKNLQENYPGWKDELSDCPCTQEEIEQSNLFESANTGLSTYHPGAASGYRSSEPIEIKSTVNPELPSLDAGQQCTFDTKGDLITHGEGAGTADAYSPSNFLNTISLDHYQTDVFPYNHLSLNDYHKEWTPNNDNDCPENWGDIATESEQETESENQNPSLEYNSESDRDTLENTIPEAETNPEADSKLGTDSEKESEADTENQAWNFDAFNDEGEAASETSESFLEADSFEIESFAEASSESFEPFSESSSGSFESFAEQSSGAFESFSESSSGSFESFAESSAVSSVESYSESAVEMA